MGGSTLETGVRQSPGKLSSEAIIIESETNSIGGNGHHPDAPALGYACIVPGDVPVGIKATKPYPFPDHCTIDHVLSAADARHERRLYQLSSKEPPKGTMLAITSCRYGGCKHYSSFGNTYYCNNQHFITWHLAEQEKEAELAKQPL